MMKKAIVLILALLIAAPAVADAIRIKGKVISEGDSVGEVRKRLGKPDNIVQLENRFGGAVGQRYEYYIGGYNPKTVLIYISQGRVQHAEIVND